MALVWKDRVLETTTTAGTGTLTLAGAVTGYQTWAAIGNGEQGYYCIYAVDAFGNPSGVWEVGLGTYTASGTTLARTAVYANSSGTQVALDLAAGAKRVMLTAAAQHLTTIPVVNGGTGLTALGSALQVLRVNSGGTAAEWATIASSPDAFAFTDVTDRDISTVITSNTVTLSGSSGVSDVWSVTVDGDGSPQIQINGGTWTDARVPAAVARNGDTLAVRLTSSSSVLTARTATVRVGGRSDVWSVTTQAFSPSMLSGLKLWLTAGPTWCFSDAGATVACGDGDPVYVWQDRSGNAYHATQATTGRRPTLRTAGGLWYVDFDEVDDYLAGSVAAMTTRVACWGVRAPASGSTAVFQLGTPTSLTGDMSRPLYVNATPKVALQGNTFDVDPAWTPVPGEDEVGYWCQKAGASAAKYGRNLAALTATTLAVSANPTAYTLGSGEGGALPWSGRVYSLVVAETEPSGADVTALRRYVGTTAGLNL